MAKKPTSKQRYRISKHTLFVAGGVVVVLLAGFLIYKDVARRIHDQQVYEQDKVRFAKTEQDMNAAFDAIEAKIGKPFDRKTSRGCSYTSAEV